MLEKKEVLLLGALFLAIVLLGGVSAARECEIIGRNDCSSGGGIAVMGLSSTSNMHGQLASEGTYNRVMCCYWSGFKGTSCQPGNKIIGLSYATNAHAEVTEGSTYTTYEVCYEDISCVSKTSSCGSNDEIMSLAYDTNAHIDVPNKYANKICCDVDYIGTYCGDGVIQGSPDGNSLGQIEECDDINSVSGDGCSDVCKIETPFCGDGTCDVGEDETSCPGDCSGVTHCGDGIIQDPNSQGINEKCDDDNTVSGDGCSIRCEIETCGNNVCDVGEDETSCPGDCSGLTYCGDGTIQAPNDAGTGGPNGLGMEQCDDDNTVSGDGCRADCVLEEIICGDGKVEGTEECDSGTNCIPPGQAYECTCPNYYEPDPLSNGCVLKQEAGQPLPYWSSKDISEEQWVGQYELKVEDVVDVVVGTTNVWLIFRNTGFSQGTQVDLKVYDWDLGIWNPDDLARTITGTVDADKHVSVNWIISQSDITATGETNPDRFYFKADDSLGDEYESGYLTTNIGLALPCEAITACRDYQTAQNCENDVNLCTVGTASVQANAPDVDCSITSINCACSWDSVGGQCNPWWYVDYTPGVDGTTGTCEYTEDTSDDCEDKFLTYSWEATWISGEEADIENMENDCVPGSNMVPCPAKVQLPFFNIYNVIGVIVIIILIYLLLNLKKKGKRKKRR